MKSESLEMKQEKLCGVAGKLSDVASTKSITHEQRDNLLYLTVDTIRLEQEANKLISCNSDGMYYYVNEAEQSSIPFYCRDECKQEAVEYLKSLELEEHSHTLDWALASAQHYNLVGEVWFTICVNLQRHIEGDKSFPTFLDCISGALWEWDLYLSQDHLENPFHYDLSPYEN